MGGMLKMNISFENKEGLEFLKSIDDNSINLILTDPPYIISKETGMNTFRDSIEKNESQAKLGGNNQIKTEKEWEQYKISKGITTDEKKKIFIKSTALFMEKSIAFKQNMVIEMKIFPWSYLIHLYLNITKN